jgi:type IV secretion system protein VirB8
VRFARQVVDKHSGTARDADHWIAEIEYRYRPDLPMDDRDRLLNPLGFRVRSYRVDRDFTAGGAS